LALLSGLALHGTAFAQTPVQDASQEVSKPADEQPVSEDLSERAARNQTQQSDADVPLVEEIVVRGSIAGLRTGVVEDPEITLSQPTHLSDVLRPLPGVEVGGTHSLVQRINIRGLDDRDLMVFIDGAPQLNFLYHHVGNVLVNPDFLKSVEVQNGATRAVYGGVGGVVRFTTKDATDFLDGGGGDLGAQVAFTGGVNAPDTVSGLLYGRVGPRADVLLYAGLLDHDDVQDGAGVRRRGLAGRAENLAAKVGLDLNGSGRLQLAYDIYEDRGDYTPRPDLGQAVNALFFGSKLIPTEYGRKNISLSYQTAADAAVAASLVAFRSDVDLRRDERGIVPPFGTDSVRFARSVLSGVDVRLATTLRLGGVEHRFDYGAELSRQQIGYDPDAMLAGAAPDREAVRAAFFIEDEIAVSRVMSARVGVRWNGHEVDYGEADGSRAWNRLTYSLGLQLRPTERLSVFASTTTLFKGPELPEPFSEGGAAEAVNPALEPETGRNSQLGFQYRSRIGTARLRLGMTAFRTRINDFAVRASVPNSSERRAVNIGDLGIDGLEAAADLRWRSSGVRLTYATADFDTGALQVGGAAGAIDVVYGLREIGDTFGLQLEHMHRSGLELRWTSEIISEKRAYDGELKDGYSVHSVSARYPTLFGQPGLTLVVGVENLFDAEYVSHASRTGGVSLPGIGFVPFNDTEPGRSFRVTLRKAL